MAAIIEISTEPTFGRIPIRITCGLPDLGRTEMGAVGVRISDSLNHSEMTLGVEIMHAGEFRMEARVVADPQDICFWKGDLGTGLVIGVIPVRDECVDAVIPTGKLKDH